MDLGRSKINPSQNTSGTPYLLPPSFDAFSSEKAGFQVPPPLTKRSSQINPSQASNMQQNDTDQSGQVVSYDSQGRRRVRVKVPKNKSRSGTQTDGTATSYGAYGPIDTQKLELNTKQQINFNDQVKSVSITDGAYSSDAYSIEQYMQNAHPPLLNQNDYYQQGTTQAIGSSQTYGYSKSAYSGSTGYTGFSGYTGTTGYTGATGYTGTTGYTGATGYTGTSGYSTEYSGYSGNSGSYQYSNSSKPNGSNEYTYQSYSYLTSAPSVQSTDSKHTKVRVRVRKNKDGTRTVVDPRINSTMDSTATPPHTILEDIAPAIGDPVRDSARLEKLNLAVRDALPMQKDPMKYNFVRPKPKKQDDSDFTISDVPKEEVKPINPMSRFMRRDCDTITATNPSTLERPTTESSNTFSSNVTTVSREMPSMWLENQADLEEYSPQLAIEVAQDISIHSLHTTTGEGHEPLRYEDAIKDIPPNTRTSATSTYVPSEPRVLDRMKQDPTMIYPRNRKMHKLPEPEGGYKDDAISTTIDYDNWEIQPHGNWIVRGDPNIGAYNTLSTAPDTATSTTRKTPELESDEAQMIRPVMASNNYNPPQYQFYAPQPRAPQQQPPRVQPYVPPYVPLPVKPAQKVKQKQPKPFGKVPTNFSFDYTPMRDPLDDLIDSDAAADTFDDARSSGNVSLHDIDPNTYQSMLVSANPTSADYVEANTNDSNAVQYVEVPSEENSSVEYLNDDPGNVVDNANRLLRKHSALKPRKQQSKAPPIKSQKPLYATEDYSDDYEEDEEEEDIIEYSYSDGKASKKKPKNQIKEYDFEEEEEEEEVQEIEQIEEYSSSEPKPKPKAAPKIIEEYDEEEEEEEVQEIQQIVEEYD